MTRAQTERPFDLCRGFSASVGERFALVFVAVSLDMIEWWGSSSSTRTSLNTSKNLSTSPRRGEVMIDDESDRTLKADFGEGKSSRAHLLRSSKPPSLILRSRRRTEHGARLR